MNGNDCDSCAILPRVEALEEAEKQHRKTHEGMFDRLRELERSDAVQEQVFEQIDEKLDTLIEWKNSEQGKPGGLLDRLKEHALSLIVGALVCYVLLQFGLPV